MRNPGELRELAKRYTGNWEKDRNAAKILPEEVDEFEKAWKGEAGRAYETSERIERATGRRP